MFGWYILLVLQTHSSMFVFQVRDDGEVMGDFNPDDKTRFVSFIAKYASSSQKSSEESFDSV